MYFFPSECVAECMSVFAGVLLRDGTGVFRRDPTTHDSPHTHRTRPSPTLLGSLYFCHHPPPQPACPPRPPQPKTAAPRRGRVLHHALNPRAVPFGQLFGQRIGASASKRALQGARVQGCSLECCLDCAGLPGRFHLRCCYPRTALLRSASSTLFPVPGNIHR